MTEEVWRTFAWVLDENLPASELIAPDFVFTNDAVAKDIYQFDDVKSRAGKKTKLRQIKVERDSHRGGLLCMPALMMATANGVDTQPVLRGVWVLENILGSPPPDPPNAVPALTPDTASALTVKERLAAHMADASCATCHREIDPVGFALENFDPVGRWRDHYPRYVEKKGRVKAVDGMPVDATGVLPDGPPITNVRDLKRWLADDPEPFVRCLSEKLLTYATGRSLNYRERKLIAKVVATQEANQYRLMDLIVALVQSDVFLK